MKDLQRKIIRLGNENLERYIDLSIDLIKLKIDSGIIDFDLKERYELAIKEMKKRNMHIMPYERRFNNLMNIYNEVMEYEGGALCH